MLTRACSSILLLMLQSLIAKTVNSRQALLVRFVVQLPSSSIKLITPPWLRKRNSLMTNSTKPYRLTAIGAMLLSLLLLLTGCGTTKTLTVTVREPLPEYLIQDCPVPDSVATTNGGLIKDISALRGAIRTCNVDKAALREWSKKE